MKLSRWVLKQGFKSSLSPSEWCYFIRYRKNENKNGIWGKWQQKFLSSHLKETPKLHVQFYYRILTLALFREIFSLEILSCLPSWIFVDMHDTSQVGSRNFIFLRNNDYYYSLRVRSPFWLVSNLQINLGICSYDVTSTNKSWYSVIKTSRLQIIVFTMSWCL